MCASAVAAFVPYSPCGQIFQHITPRAPWLCYVEIQGVIENMDMLGS